MAGDHPLQEQTTATGAALETDGSVRDPQSWSFEGIDVPICRAACPRKRVARLDEFVGPKTYVFVPRVGFEPTLYGF
jgi:hypothetical protein